MDYIVKKDKYIAVNCQGFKHVKDQGSSYFRKMVYMGSLMGAALQKVTGMKIGQSTVSPLNHDSGIICAMINADYSYSPENSIKVMEELFNDVIDEKCDGQIFVGSKINEQLDIMEGLAMDDTDYGFCDEEYSVIDISDEENKDESQHDNLQYDDIGEPEVHEFSFTDEDYEIGKIDEISCILVRKMILIFPKASLSDVEHFAHTTDSDQLIAQFESSGETLKSVEDRRQQFKEKLRKGKAERKEFFVMVPDLNTVLDRNFLEIISKLGGKLYKTADGNFIVSTKGFCMEAYDWGIDIPGQPEMSMTKIGDAEKILKGMYIVPTGK